MPPICEQNSRDSNEVELSFAEEECLRQLPEGEAAIAATGTVTMSSTSLGAVAASGTLTINVNPTAGDTVGVNGQTITFRASGAVANEVNIGASATATATALAAVLTNVTGVNASAAGAVVTITAEALGTAGNSIALANPSNGASITRSGATLTGGAAAHSVTIGGNAFAFVASAPGAGEVLIGASVTTAATNLAAAINALADFNATSAAGVVTISAAVAGEDGNLYALTKTGANVAVSAATLTGGVEAVPGAQWFKTEPNSFGDFGSELTKAVRSFISPSRQRKKGRTVGEEAAGGFNTDFTKTSLNRLLQGFMFADARELPTTKSLVRAVGIDKLQNASLAAGYQIKTDAAFAAGQMVIASGFDNASNNGLKVVTAVGATTYDKTVQVTPACVDEAGGADKHVEACGYQFASGDVSLTVTSGIPALVSIAQDFTALPNFIPGAWVFIGGDASSTAFANNQGYARIKSVSANAVVFDDVTFTPVTEAGTGKTIRVFCGPIIRNEKAAALIKQRSYQLERTLGQGDTSAQAEYLEGAIANEFSMEFPQEDKIAADLTFVAASRSFRTGEPGDELKDGERYEAEGGEVYNTTSDLFRMRIAINDPTSANLLPLVGFVSEGSLTLTNNATPNKALTVLGALDFQFGDFEVGGSLTAYFADVSAPRRIKDDTDCSFNVIGGYDNAGFVFDMPLLTLSGGGLTVEKDAAIMLPIENSAVESAAGYTLLYQFFPYLPDAAMPQ